MKISGSIVCYNTELDEVLHIAHCFLACENVRKFYVLDNSPEDKISVSLSFDDRIQYHHFPENLGYGKAHNVALRKSLDNADYHVVLNTDLSFDKECVGALSKFMESRSDVGLVMPKIIYPDGSLQYLCKDNPTPFILLTRRFFKGIAASKVEKALYYYQNRDKDYERPMFHIPFLSGCFMFLRCTTLKEVGLFDENIFMYTEDADLCRRILAKAETAYWPSSVAIHDFKGGVHKDRKLTLYGFKSAVYYFNKWSWKNKLKREVVQ